MANPFVHIELQTRDLARAKEFYSGLFDWKLEDIPAPGGGMIPESRAAAPRSSSTACLDPTGAVIAMWKPKPGM
jgi:predicted enzyme related to lactoylglutathione lyase